MTDKDPKDMTASELLRWLADDDNQSNCQACSRFYASDECGGKMCSDWKRDIADKIDAEIVKAYSEKLDTCAMRWAKANGWPDFREGEDFGAWLERCAIPRPRYEDGEPVQFDYDTDELNGIEKFIFLRSGGGCCQMQDADGNICNVYPGERVKRPATEVLGADGLPIKVGETVWGILSATKGIVNSLNDDSTAYVEWDDGRWSPCIDCCNLTHTPPDTQERIDRDARKGYMTYWGCVGCSCERCPAMIDGDKPWRWYHADSCEGAMVLDLLRRQRELDKRTGGAE